MTPFQLLDAESGEKYRERVASSKLGSLVRYVIPNVKKLRKPKVVNLFAAAETILL